METVEELKVEYLELIKRFTRTWKREHGCDIMVAKNHPALKPIWDRTVEVLTLLREQGWEPDLFTGGWTPYKERRTLRPPLVN